MYNPRVQGTGNQRLIRLRLGGAAARAFTPVAVYRIAATWLAADREVPELEPFAAPGLPTGVETGQPTDWSPREVERVVYRGPGIVSGALRAVECRRVGHGWEVDIPDVCRLGVALDGSEVAALDVPPDRPESLLVEAVIGPGLILSFAVHGVFCLHASAIDSPHGVIAFLGESGSGKSTLASFLASEASVGWPRVADDLLPVQLTPSGIEALPHFPQLKLADRDQYPTASAEHLPVSMVCVLAPRPERLPEHVALRPLGVLAGSLGLLGHTAAVRLFDRHLAASHLESCARAAMSARLLELGYPLSLGSLPLVAAALAAAPASDADGAGPTSAGRENRAQP